MARSNLFKRTHSNYRGPQIRIRWRWVRWIIILVALVVAPVTALYTVPTDSAGIVKRFGKYNRTTQPGIHLKIPYWIEKAISVPVKKIQKQEFGFRTLKAGVDSQYLGVDEIQARRIGKDGLKELIRESGESTWGLADSQLAKRAGEILTGEYIMLTGDLNIADVEWIVQYKIKNAQQFLFNIRNARQTIRDASQAVMRQLIGNGSVDEAITIGRIEYEVQGKEMLQDLLDKYLTGIHIVTVKLQSSNPPAKVRPAFNEVNKALQQKEQRINEAMKDYNTAIPRTRGEAKRVVEAAKGYAAERVNRSQGDVTKFEKILLEYQKAPTITRQRMYFETMSRLLPKIPEKWIIEQGGADGGILLKLGLDNETSE
ncbi:MAG: FtsH protease activity modulator HflK [Planctomycetota bacterium]